MKNLVISLLLIGLFCGAASADTIYLTRDGSSNGFSIVSDELGRSVAPRVIVRCNLSFLEANDISAARGEFTQLAIPGFQRSQEVGSPSVPMMSRLMEVPFGAELSVRVISQREMEYTLAELGISHPLAPCQPSHRKDTEEYSYECDAQSYERDAYTSYPLVQVEESGVLRSYRIASLQVSPVQYNPVRGTLRVTTELEFEVCMEGADLSRTAEVKSLHDSPYFSWVGERLLTPDSLRSLSRSEAGPVTYAIVADRMFASALQPFVNAKTAKGMRVVVAYTDEIGKTTASIKSYLHGLYNNATPEKTAPSFILFAGDNEQIPAFSGTKGSYITDLYYGAVTPDCLPEMLSGRFSAQEVSQILPQIEKTLEYEGYKFPDKTFLKDTVMIAGWDSSHAVEWGYPQINYGIDNYFNTGKGFNLSNKFLTSGSQQNASKIRALIGAGACFVNYTAHGSQTNWSDPSLTIGDINSMPNKGRYPLVVGNCCLTNSFQVGTCFGEAWLRADGRGAIGYIGGSSYTYWDEDLWWGVGFYAIAHPNSSGAAPRRADTKQGAYDVAFAGKLVSNAAFMMVGNLAVEESTSPRKVYYWEVYHLMGDPGLMTYWGVPSSNPVQHPAELARNAASIDVQAEEGSYVGVSMNGQVVGAGVAGENGRVSIQLQPFSSPGTATISVVRQNRIPYTATVEIR